MSNQLVNVNGTFGIISEVLENSTKVNFGFGIVEFKKDDDIVLELVDGDIPSHLEGISHEDVMTYTKESKKRSEVSKMSLCRDLFIEMIGDEGCNLRNGSIAPVDIKNEMMSQFDVTEKGCSTYYYKIKSDVEKEIGVSLSVERKKLGK